MAVYYGHEISGQAALFLTVNMPGVPPLNIDEIQCGSKSPPLVRLVYPGLNVPVFESIKQSWVQDVFLWFPCVVPTQRADSEQ